MRPPAAPRRLRAAAVLAALAICVGGCSRIPSMTARWSGADTGSAVLPARAAWCGRSGPLLLFAMSGDTGIAIAAYPADSLMAGNFPIADPAAGVIRPGAAVAARWIRRLVMSDLRGTSGRLTLQPTAGAVTGRFSTHAEGVTTTAQVSLEGSFSGVPLSRGGPDCAGYSGVD